MRTVTQLEKSSTPASRQTHFPSKIIKRRTNAGVYCQNDRNNITAGFERRKTLSCGDIESDVSRRMYA